jgi:hypothetical protein
MAKLRRSPNPDVILWIISSTSAQLDLVLNSERRTYYSWIAGDDKKALEQWNLARSIVGRYHPLAAAPGEGSRRERSNGFVRVLADAE